MRIKDLHFPRRSIADESVERLGPTQQRAVKWSRRISRSMDAQWGIGPVRFGLETIVDLVPVLGDVVSAVASLYQLWVAFQLRLGRWSLVRMLSNVGVDFLIGLVPFAGDLFDSFFKVHQRNQRIIDRHLQRKGLESS
jgi:hypothetical protein